MIEYQPGLGVGLPKMDKETQEQSEEDEDDRSSDSSGELRFKCTYAILMKELAGIEDSKSGQCLEGFSVTIDNVCVPNGLETSVKLFSYPS